MYKQFDDPDWLTDSDSIDSWFNMADEDGCKHTIDPDVDVTEVD